MAETTGKITIDPSKPDEVRKTINGILDKMSDALKGKSLKDVTDKDSLQVIKQSLESLQKIQDSSPEMAAVLRGQVLAGERKELRAKLSLPDFPRAEDIDASGNLKLNLTGIVKDVNEGLAKAVDKKDNNKISADKPKDTVIKPEDQVKYVIDSLKKIVTSADGLTVTVGDKTDDMESKKITFEGKEITVTMSKQLAKAIMLGKEQILGMSDDDKKKHADHIKAFEEAMANMEKQIFGKKVTLTAEEKRKAETDPNAPQDTSDLLVKLLTDIVGGMMGLGQGGTLSNTPVGPNDGYLKAVQEYNAQLILAADGAGDSTALAASLRNLNEYVGKYDPTTKERNDKLATIIENSSPEQLQERLNQNAGAMDAIRNFNTGQGNWNSLHNALRSTSFAIAGEAKKAKEVHEKMGKEGDVMPNNDHTKGGIAEYKEKKPAFKKELTAEEKAKAAVDALMKVADTNKDGNIDADELNKLKDTKEAKAFKVDFDKAADWLKTQDKDGNKMLSAEELKGAFIATMAGGAPGTVPKTPAAPDKSPTR